MNKYGRSAKLVDQIRKGNFAVFAMKSVIGSEPVVDETGPKTTLWQYRWHHSTINWILWLTLQNGLGKSVVILLTIIIQYFHKWLSRNKEIFTIINNG